MDAADADYPDEVQNGAAEFSETGSQDKQKDENILLKSEYFRAAQHEDVEKLSLLDRFLSSEVVENGIENTTELIGDELIDGPAADVIDENALLDEITNDLDQEDLDDEETAMDDYVAGNEANGDADASTSTEVTSSKQLDDESTISHSGDLKNAGNEADEGNTVIESSEKTAGDECQSMEVDDHETLEKDCQPDSTERSAASSDEQDFAIDERATDRAENILKVDDEQDNNLLEEMIDSPHSSDHESSDTSELLEKDDTVTRDSNDDVKMDQQLIVESSNENSNISESGAMAPETGSDDAVEFKFKQDAELHIMDDAGDNVSVESKEPKTELPESNADELSVGKQVKCEEVSASDNVENRSDECSSETVGRDATQSPELPAKRKNEEQIDEPENKKKRIEEEVPSESVGSPEHSVAVGNDAEMNVDDIVASTVADDNVQSQATDTNKDDDDDVLIVGEIKQTEKTADAQSSAATEIQDAPVRKAKILILDTQAIANDLGEETADKTIEASSSVVPENDSEVSSSQEDSTIEQAPVEPSVEVAAKSTEPARPKAPTALTLDPAPQKTLCPTAFSLNFVRKFHKNFDKMTRNDLEELLIQKCVEAIVHKSDHADMRNKIEKQESKLLSYSTKYQELSKQYRDLEMVIKF